MDTLFTLTDQKPSNKITGSNMYITTDGVLRFCIIAPLLELPHDFKEWYKPSATDCVNIYPQFTYQQNTV